MRRMICGVLIALGLNTPASVLAESPRADRLVISLAGDCMIGSEGRFANLENSFVQVVAEKGFNWPFSDAVDLFANDDLTLVNLEGTFTNARSEAKKRFNFRAPPEYADVLTLGSVEAVNLANNHTLDYLERGLNDTKQALDERGIAYCAQFESTVVEIKGVRIALVGLCYPMLRSSVSWMREQVAAYRDQPDVDLIIASFHWGLEYRYKPVQDQWNTARLAIDSGADLVVGTHPHVLQGIEMYEGKPILYSLGNFSFGGSNMPRKDRDTAVIQVEYDIGGEGKPSLVRLEAFPYLVTEVPLGRVQDYRPVKVTDPEDARRILEKLSLDANGLPESFFETGLWLAESAGK